MSKNVEFELNIGSNEDVVATSFLTLNDDNIEEYGKQDIVINIEFEFILTSIKRYFFHQWMVGFVNKIELSDQKYQTNGNVWDENHNINLLFPMKDFVPLGTDC